MHISHLLCQLCFDYSPIIWPSGIAGWPFRAIGNTLNDGTWTYTWQNGRQVARMQSIDADASFVYNENGLRVQKPVNGVVTKYTLNGKHIAHMNRGKDELHFFYDASGKPVVVVYNGTLYSYVKNLQGDIVAILNSAGTVVVSYVYDVWGRPIATTGSMADTLGVLNPFRYRGYVFDEETGLYYLRSRYYNTVLCRFDNADLRLGSRDLLFEHNIYAYCANSPEILFDENGEAWVQGAYAPYLGFYHAYVQLYIKTHNANIKMEQKVGNTIMRADLYNTKNGSTYEVKPDNENAIILGLMQLWCYTIYSDGKMKFGTEKLNLPPTTIFRTPNTTITMKTQQVGSLILYSMDVKREHNTEGTMLVAGMTAAAYMELVNNLVSYAPTPSYGHVGVHRTPALTGPVTLFRSGVAPLLSDGGGMNYDLIALSMMLQ